MQYYDDFYLTEENSDEFILLNETEDDFMMWQGRVGPYYVPYVDANGYISWTNTGGLPNPPERYIMGLPGRGLVIGGIVETEAELPSVGEDGVTWLVGDGQPYNGFVWINTEWVNLGEVAVGPVGPTGPTGPTPEFSIGEVTTGETGDPAAATITGTAENPVLNLTLPKGAAGTPGETGATPDFSIGTVTTGETGEPAAASITGTPEEPVLNLTLPKGNTGAQGLGLPSGGNIGEVLIKASGADYDTAWGQTLTLLKFTVNISAAATEQQIGSVSDAAINADMEVIRSEIADPGYQTSEWLVTFSSGTLTITGTASAATTVKLIIGEA